MGVCSIRDSETGFVTVAAIVLRRDKPPACRDHEYRCYLKLRWSGRQDSNLRPPVPKTGALPGCATPRSVRGRIANCLLNEKCFFHFFHLGPAFSGKPFIKRDFFNFSQSESLLKPVQGFQHKEHVIPAK